MNFQTPPYHGPKGCPSHILEAKADCSHGEWKKLIGRSGHQGVLPFKKSHAHALMTIASDDRIVRHAGHLPSDTHTAAVTLTRVAATLFKPIQNENTF